MFMCHTASHTYRFYWLLYFIICYNILMSEEGVIERALPLEDVRANSLIIILQIILLLRNNHPMQNTTGCGGDTALNSIILTNGVLSCGNDLLNLMPLALPTDAHFNLNVPLIHSMGTLQATDRQQTYYFQIMVTPIVIHLLAKQACLACCCRRPRARARALPRARPHVAARPPDLPEETQVMMRYSVPHS